MLRCSVLGLILGMFAISMAPALSSKTLQCILGVAGVFGGSLFSAMHGSLVTSSLVRETTEIESQNYGYKFGQEER